MKRLKKIANKIAKKMYLLENQLLRVFLIYKNYLYRFQYKLKKKTEKIIKQTGINESEYIRKNIKPSPTNI